MIFVFRLGVFILVFYIDRDVLVKVINDFIMFGFFDVVVGGIFKNMSIFVMSVILYINFFIIMQFLIIVIFVFEEFVK